MTLAVKEQDGMTLAKVKEQDGMTLAKVRQSERSAKYPYIKKTKTNNLRGRRFRVYHFRNVCQPR